MKVPRGTKVSSLREKKLAEALRSAEKMTGYIRLSSTSESLRDFFLFLAEGREVGAFAELEDEGELFGDSAHKKILATPLFDIVELFELPSKVLDILFENYPEAALGSHKEVERKVTVEESGNFFRIANIRVPILSPHKLFLKISTTDFFALLSDLKDELHSGFVRIFAENLDVVEEGCLFFSGGQCVGAVYECGPKVRYGVDALPSIQSCFTSPKGLIDVYAGDIARILERNEGISVSGDVRAILKEKKEEEKKNQAALFSDLGLSPRAPAMVYPSDDIFAYQTLLRILAEKEFEGIIRIGNAGQGVVVFQGGHPAGARLFGKGRLSSNKAYERILEMCEGECEIEVYPLDASEGAPLYSRKELALTGKEATGDLEKFVMRELGEESEIELRRASAFKKQWENRRREHT